MVDIALSVTHALLNQNLVLQLVQWVLGAGKKENETWLEYFNDKERRRQLLRYVWLVVVLLALAASLLALMVSKPLFHSFRPSIAFLVFIWAVIFGGTALMALLSKLIITIFGALLGVSLSEISTGFDGLLEKTAAGVAKISHHLVEIAGPVSNGNNDFITWMVWMFVVIVALLCLPAFFLE
jgi:hypothetical protein